MEAYRYPHYYEIALAPADLSGELDFFEAAIAKFSGAKVRRVFELGAGTAPYLQEWHRRGYQYCGLDLSPAMLEFARERAAREGIAAEFVLGDMRDLDRGLGPFDLAYIMLGSLYTRSNREFLDHLARMADLLTPGALYLLDSVVWFRPFHDYRRSWTRRRGGVTVRTRYRAEPLDPIAQTYNETSDLQRRRRRQKADDRGPSPGQGLFPAGVPVPH